MRIPTFFLRTTPRLLLFQTLIAWLCIRSHFLPLPSTLTFALTTTLGSYINTTKDILDSRFSFPLPWETSFFLPAILDAWIIAEMPDLAILLGTHPCDQRFETRDPQTGICTRVLASQCFSFASMYSPRLKNSSMGFQILEACEQLYHTTAGEEIAHVTQCHKGEGDGEDDSLMRFVGCVKVMEYWERKKGICGKQQPFLRCVGEYGAFEEVVPILEALREKRDRREGKVAI
ncbi:hypothetical protein AUEXF2481DRAFT_579436 [Aureobasidium subglaciale EXF-2481]|uniref:Uncharacterized protein n=1 Tax=Aureobasidium subglaciale (strain EXF-2481) TaxID=1043005 RepID=A0A074YTQ1_AURSE|nr:uncharacterized protein AUEXF2481DRAFT_579436 [Aureobasidium subglaciale EXF-2481]KEQ90211.1 hypothetical protein AUEXF2481DRAFT_579436 [Aureobasidium subglaciale EXF-2481]